MKSFSAQLSDSVPADQLEVSLFGPGVGESVVVHIGSGEWVIVDSCLDSSGRPVALSYLEAIGVDFSQSVKFVIITHWHDDHIKGVSEIIRHCVNARVVFSSALLQREFLTLVDAMNDPIPQIDRGISGLNEMSAVVRELHKRGRKLAGRQQVQAFLTPAAADKRLYTNDHIELWCLSPSDLDCMNAISEFGVMVGGLSTGYRKVFPAPSANKNAVALWIVFGDADVLLGADLENSPSEHSGWSAIVKSHGRPQRQAAVFKVPHHGSISGHNSEVVESLLKDETVSILTTFNKGKTPIPTQDDIERISSYSSQVYVATLPKNKAPRRDSAVEKMMKQVVTKRYVLGGGMGHIRIRMEKGGGYDVQLNGPAMAV